MSYNAVLRKENAAVVGRVLLSNLYTLPRKWDVVYGEDFIPLITDLKTLLCDSKVPLSVYTVPVERQITVESEHIGGEFELSVTRNVNVYKLKNMICKKMEIEGKGSLLKDHSLDLYLNDEDKPLGCSKTIEEFVLQRRCTLHLKLRKILRRQGLMSTLALRYNPIHFKAVDLEAAHKHERGVPVTNEWEGYSYGLTIYGTCPTKSCRSHKIPLKQTSHRAGYGFLRIDLNNETFHCPACRGSFPPANFVVCDARALFRYKKSQGRYEVQSTVMESFGGIDEYASFNDEGENSEYDWIEVKTVKKNESFHVCGRCDLVIRKKVDAVLYDCGHPVHLACKEDQCGICNARILPDVEFTALVSSITGKTVEPQAGPSGTCGKRRRTSTKFFGD